MPNGITDIIKGYCTRPGQILNALESSAVFLKLNIYSHSPVIRDRSVAVVSQCQ